MEFLGMLLRPSVGRPIVDRTGLQGSYRIKLRYARTLSPAGPSLTPSPDDLPDVFWALPAQLGLKLESSQAEREVLVVDRLERPGED